MLWNSTPSHERDKGLVLKRLHSFVLPNHSLLFYYILWNRCTPYGIKIAYGNWLGIPGLYTILSCVFQIHAYILDIFQIIYKIYFLDDQTKTKTKTSHKQNPLLYGSSRFFFFFIWCNYLFYSKTQDENLMSLFDLQQSLENHQYHFVFVFISPPKRYSLIILLTVLKAAPINPYVCTLADNVEDPDMSFAAVYQHCNAPSISFNKHIQRALIILLILYNDVFWTNRSGWLWAFQCPKETHKWSLLCKFLFLSR